ncbi:hypothetical protein [Paraburkholderia tuberum]|uniref:hypothetical protein n=2 Tax=Paraburkholderia TaxID=1822464 RepID=UPI0013A6C663|nr:hypothetical protein [Paraburkholderia tuberum]
MGDWAGVGRVPAGVTGAGAVMVNSPRGWMNASSFITKSRINKSALNTIPIKGASNLFEIQQKMSRRFIKNKNYLKKISKHFFRLMMRKNDSASGARDSRHDCWQSESFYVKASEWAARNLLSGRIAATIAAQNA